jgi:UDP-N-acetylmuramoyl-tripeptide--D-alanyl-D-alanine ligase
MDFTMSAGECAAAIGGRLIAGSERTVFTSVSIDTRNIHSGALFFAIPGLRFDGHDFVDRSFKQGAAGVVVSRMVPGVDQGVLIEVSDTSKALLCLSAHHRVQWGGRLICITGSAGKTTTKEILAQLLSAKYAVYKSPGNYNNIYGLSQALLDLEAKHEVAVVEIGMNAPGEVVHTMWLVASE